MDINLQKTFLQIENINNNIYSLAQFQQQNLIMAAGLKDLLLQFQTSQVQISHRNPLNRFGKKCFSQTDEDGITIELLRRLNISSGVYAEFGVGNGLENNTLILAAMGWSGFWVGAEDLAFSYSKATKFSYQKNWITLSNISQHAKNGMKDIKALELDLISLDLDGNDIYFVEKLLSDGITPKIFIVEYNAKFIPPSKFQIDYDPNHQWMGDDYFGAALTNFVELFEKNGYKLVCCNSHTGANAFFVRNDYGHLFDDVPTDILDIYSPPRYHTYNAYGHRQSTKVIEKILNL
jgi:hypothetical protein